MLKMFKWNGGDNIVTPLNTGGDVIHKMYLVSLLTLSMYILLNILLPLNNICYESVTKLTYIVIALAIFSLVTLRVSFIIELVNFRQVMLIRYSIWYTVFIASVIGILYRILNL